MILRTLASIILSAISYGVYSQNQPTFTSGSDPKPKGKKWVLVENMSDEFDGTTLDTEKWQDKPVGNGWNWDGRPPGLFRPENVVIKDGNMNVTVSKLDSPVTKEEHTFTHQGAIIRSLNPGQVGWYYETRMKANRTVMSSTFWLMTKYDCEKKEELDIQECVGQITDKTEDWAKNFDRIFHSNAIHRKTECNPEPTQIQGAVETPTKNWEQYYIYAAWWKSTEEVQFFLNGEYTYSITPSITWDMPAYLQMAIETYDWNPIPDDGGLVEKGTWEERTTKYDWIRTWKME